MLLFIAFTSVGQNAKKYFEVFFQWFSVVQLLKKNQLTIN